MPKTRTFIAIEAADQAHGAAMSVIERLRSAAEGMKWIDPEKLHFTLQFLGDLDDREMAEVCMRTVRVAQRHAQFELEVRGVGAFPSIQKPRTLWLGAGEGAEEFISLHADIERAIAVLGFRPERRAFAPHLTIGRGGPTGGGRASTAVLTERLAALADFDGGRMSVDEVIVFASELGRDGAEYSVLARAPLGASP
jgi:2'-5' RNA ligase